MPVTDDVQRPRARPHSAVYILRKAAVETTEITESGGKKPSVRRPTSAASYPTCVASAVEARHAALNERQKRQLRVRHLVAESDSNKQLADMFELCDELQLGNHFVQGLQAVLSTPRLKTELDIGFLEHALSFLRTHRHITLNVLRKIEERERVSDVMANFICEHTVGSANRKSVKGGEKEEIAAFKRQPLTAAAEVEADSILVALTICTNAVNKAIADWRLSANEVESLAITSNITVPLGHNVGLPAPVERCFIYKDSDYAKRMTIEHDKLRRLRSLWSARSEHHLNKKMQTECQPEDPKIDSLASSMNSTSRLELIRIQMEEDASVAIQRAFRSHRDRLRMKYVYIRANAARQIQRWYRNQLAKSALEIAKGRILAATLIQTMWRSVAAKSTYRALKTARDAAIIIQRAWRGWAAHMYWQSEIHRKSTNVQAMLTIVRWIWSLKFKHELSVYLRRKKSAVFIQRWFRALKTFESWESTDADTEARYRIICSKADSIRADSREVEVPMIAREDIEVLPHEVTVAEADWSRITSATEAQATYVTDKTFPTAVSHQSPVQTFKDLKRPTSPTKRHEPIELPAPTPYPAITRLVRDEPSRIRGESYGVAQAALTVQRCGRALKFRREVTSIQQSKVADAILAHRRELSICLIQAFTHGKISSLVAKGRHPPPGDVQAAISIQRWWKKWSSEKENRRNRYHREYLSENEDNIKFSVHQLSQAQIQQAQLRKKQAVRIANWAKKHLLRRKALHAAQATIAKAWFHYKTQRQYFLKKRIRNRQAQLEAERLLSMKREEKRQREHDAGLVIYYYMLKYRAQQLVKRIENACSEILSRPDRDGSARIMQKFWKLSIAKMQTSKMKRIRDRHYVRSLQEERLLMAAIKIQSFYRLMIARQMVEAKRRRIQADRSYAASVIQRNVRILLAKLRADQLKLGATSMYKEYRMLLYKSKQMGWGN